MRKSKLIVVSLLLAFLIVFSTTSLSFAAPNPPRDDTWSKDFPAGMLCSFDVRLEQTGKIKLTQLPHDRILITWPALHIKVINTSVEPWKSVSLNATGPMSIIAQPDGGEVVTLNGRGVPYPYYVPSVGFVVYVGHFVYRIDPAGNYAQIPIGHGQILDVCAMISQ